MPSLLSAGSLVEARSSSLQNKLMLKSGSWQDGCGRCPSCRARQARGGSTSVSAANGGASSRKASPRLSGTSTAEGAVVTASTRLPCLAHSEPLSPSTGRAKASMFPALPTHTHVVQSGVRIFNLLRPPAMHQAPQAPPAPASPFSRPQPRAPRSPAQSAQVRVRNRRREYLDRHPAYFDSLEHELAGRSDGMLGPIHTPSESGTGLMWFPSTNSQTPCSTMP